MKKEKRSNIIMLWSLCVLSLFAGCKISPKIIDSTEDKTILNLKKWLADSMENRVPLESLDFSKQALTKSQAEKATTLLFQDKQAIMKKEYGQQWDNRVLNYNSKRMPFYYQIFGEAPADGRSLFISLHGGGGTTADVNDQQYENQKHLYDSMMSNLEGIYLAARAPTNTWNLWHQNHIDDFFNVLIQLAVIKENVNPDKVYLMGYSAGGDGVYQLAPRMADRWAAASMMAGHPNETSPLGLKNIPFAIHMGALDGAYKRNEIAQKWKVVLDSLENNAPGTYIHQVQLHDGLGHWMELNDAVALPWIKKYKRNPIPQQVLWKQDDRHHNSFYWIGTPEDQIKKGGEIVANYNPKENEIDIISNYSDKITLYIKDKMLDLDTPITIKYQGETIYHKKLNRSILNIHKTLSAKGDVHLSFPCAVSIINNQLMEEH